MTLQVGGWNATETIPGGKMRNFSMETLKNIKVELNPPPYCKTITVKGIGAEFCGVLYDVREYTFFLIFNQILDRSATSHPKPSICAQS